MKNARSFFLVILATMALGSLIASTTTSITVTRRDGSATKYPVAASTKTLAGAFAALDGSHNLVNATDASSRRVVGIHAQETDNSAGSAGDLSSIVEKGLFLVKNSSGNAVTDAHIGQACFIEDNETVASSGGTNFVVAGIVEDVTTDGVWVWVGVPFAPAAPNSVTLTSTNGTAAAAADLAALKTEAEKIGDDVRAIHAALVLRGLLK